MPRFAVLIAATLGVAALSSPARAGASEPVSRAAAADSRVIIPVEGLGCASCTLAVRRALKKLDGVKSIGPGSQENQAVITYDGTKVTPGQMVDAINRIGFKAGTPVKG